MDATLTLIEKTAFMKSVPLLAAIPTEALAELAARAREIHCAPGEVLYREGDPYRGAFFVIEGTLEQRKGRALIRVVHPRMTIGEIWLGENEPHQYTLTAIEHAHVLNVTRADVVDGMLDFPEFGVALAQTMARVANEQITRVLELEALIARLHATLEAAGVEPPDPRVPEAPEHDGRDSADRA